MSGFRVQSAIAVCRNHGRNPDESAILVGSVSLPRTLVGGPCAPFGAIISLSERSRTKPIQRRNPSRKTSCTAPPTCTPISDVGADVGATALFRALPRTFKKNNPKIPEPSGINRNEVELSERFPNPRWEPTTCPASELKQKNFRANDSSGEFKRVYPGFTHRLSGSHRAKRAKPDETARSVVETLPAGRLFLSDTTAPFRLSASCNPDPASFRYRPLPQVQL